MQSLTVDIVKNSGWLVFEAIVGSKSYGLDTATSDTDIRGVFVLPKHLFYGFEYTPQVSNESNDIVYYELGRFMELLSKNNPNILELLNVPTKCILHKDAMMERLSPALFLSKLCEKTFANYAFTQIKKAYSLEKKILNPMEGKRKSVLDFCFVYADKEAVPLEKYATENSLLLKHIGLASLSHLRDCYNLYYSVENNYMGIVRNEQVSDVSLSSIPKNELPVAMLYFNKDGYSAYCKRYKEYWDWVEKRNDERYKNTVSHGKNYDSKNMQHVFRLLLMAKEIATEKTIHVFRNDRAFLLDIKAGKFEYEDLVRQAEALKDELPILYQQSDLPEEPDVEKINELLVDIREEWYK